MRGERSHETDRLVLAEASGAWAIRSTSQTVYYVDTDSNRLFRRVGPASTPGLADDRWARLVSVEALFTRDWGVIRVGDRHRYVYDYDPNADKFGWWIQRLVTSITRVEAQRLASLANAPGEGLL